MLGSKRPRDWRRHINPDGSEGGWVHNTTIVDEGAYIAPTAVVEDGAHVLASHHLEGGDLLTTRGTVVQLGVGRRSAYKPAKRQGARHSA